MHYSNYQEEQDFSEQEPEYPISKNSAKIVETKLGIGKILNTDAVHKNKLKVLLEDGRKVLCSPDKVKIIGFID